MPNASRAGCKRNYKALCGCGGYFILLLCFVCLIFYNFARKYLKMHVENVINVGNSIFVLISFASLNYFVAEKAI